MDDIRLMKGNEAIAEALIRSGSDAYFGYPITPQSEIMEYLTAEKPEERTGMVFLQAESEVAAINMVYGAAASGKKAVTSSSSPGYSLMQEGMSYLAGTELPALVINISRGGPGLGSIMPSQADYYQATRGGGHGDYRTPVLAPSSVQEMADFVDIAWHIAFTYRNPVLIIADGMIGQMMEKVSFGPQKERWSKDYIRKHYPWAANGKAKNRERTIHKSVELVAEVHEQWHVKLIEKYKRIQENEVRYELSYADDAEILVVAYGSIARICQKGVEIARKRGLKVGLLRPITLWPFPNDLLKEMAEKVKVIVSVELSHGQMVDDVRLAVNGKVRVESMTKLGGIFPVPEEIVDTLQQMIGK